MPAAELPLPQRTQPPAPAALAWLGTIGVALGTGFAAVYVQSTFAPVGVFPLLVGALTGLAVAGVWEARGGATRRTLITAGVVAGVIAVGALHYGSYIVVRNDDERRRSLVPPQVLLADPSRGQENPALRTFGAFVEREWRRGRSLGSHHIEGAWLGVWWALDAAAIVGMAAFIVPRVAKRIESAAERRISDDERGATE